MKKDLKHYTNLLPKRITLTVEKSDQGLWATIKEIPFCYTQASSSSELIEMLNDAILTHFEVPKNFRNKVGYYAPVSQKHLQMEDMFRKLISIEHKINSGKEAKEIFNLTNFSIC